MTGETPSTNTGEEISSNDSEDQELSPESSANLEKRIKELRDDINTMENYLFASGKTLSPDMISDLAELNCSRDKLKAKKKDNIKLYTMVLEAHNQLSALIAPATPITLRATERLGNSFRIKNYAINKLIYLTLFCLVGFIITLPFALKETPITMETSPTEKAKDEASQKKLEKNVTPNEPEKNTTNPNNLTGLFNQQNQYKDKLLLVINILFAAGLGAGFYSLTTSRRYILNRTFDPSYNQIYYIRFVLGLTAGTILGYFGGTGLFAKNITENSQLVSGISIGVLSIVGGYSADAVAKILQRIAETLVTLVQGSNQNEIDMKESQIKTEALMNLNRDKKELVKTLHNLLGEVQGENTDSIREKIQSTIETFMIKS